MHKETTDLVEAVKKSSWPVQNLAKRAIEPVEMTQRQAAIAISRYVAVMNRDLEGVDFVDSTQLIHTLEDCIDYATDRGGQSLTFSGTWLHTELDGKPQLGGKLKPEHLEN